MKNWLLILISVSFVNIFGQITFTSTSGYYPGNNPQANFCSDFNNDGKQDIVSCTWNFNSDIVYILNGNGNGTFTFGNYYALSANPHTICGSDFNNDGKIDIATGNNNDSISVLFGNGTGGFSSPTYYSAGGINPTAISTGDFNGDGSPDIAVANYNSNNISVMLGSPTGTFSSATNYSVTNSPESLFIGDFDHDGNDDVVYSGVGSNLVFISLGSPSGTLSASSIYLAGGILISVSGGDFNNDNNLDIVTSNNGNTISVLMGNGNGSFMPPVNYPVNNPGQVLASDLNCDGQLDIICSQYTASALGIFQGNGTGNFAPVIYSFTGGNGGSIAPGEFNGDGKPDFVAANSTNNIKIILNKTPLFSVATSTNTICKGLPVTLTATGALSFTWTNGVLNGVPFTPTITNSYSVSATIGGCSDSKVLSISVLPTPTITISQTSTLSCPGETVGCHFFGANTWSINGLSSPPTQTFAPLITTIYNLTGKSSNGCMDSLAFTHNIAVCNGIQSFEDSHIFTVYPNPNMGKFTIESNYTSHFYFKLSTITGQIYYDQKLYPGLNAINLNEISKGLYYYECVNDNKELYRGKLIIE